MLPDLPGWDSLSTVSRNHSIAEIAGIIVLAALVVAEVVAYKYGKRKDLLTEQQQHVTDQRHDEEVARLHLETAKANKATEELRRQNLELEEAVSPRILEINGPAKELQKFAGSEVSVFVVADFEPRRLAGSILAVLNKAEWKKPIPAAIDLTDSFEGVVVEYVKQRPVPTPDNPDRPVVEDAMQRLYEIRVAEQKTEPRRIKAEAIATQLSSAKIATRVQLIPSTRMAEMNWPRGISEDGIVIRVGAKPATYFLEQKYPELKEMRERTESALKRAREQWQRLDPASPLPFELREPPSTDNK